MSVLGEYIHYHKGNYRKYGIQRKRKPTVQHSNRQAYNYVQSKINNLPDIDEGVINELRKRLQNMVSTGKYGKIETDMSIQARETIYDMLAARADSVNWNRGGVGKTKDSLGGMGSFLGSVKKDGTVVQNMFYTNDLKRLKAISKEAENIRKKINGRINTIVKNNYHTTEKKLNALNDLYRDWAKLAGKETTGLEGLSTEETIALIKKRMKYLSAYREIAKEFGEMMTSSVSDTAKGLAGDALKKEIMKNIVGDNTTEVSFDADLVYNYTIGNFATYDEEGNKFIVGKTKDKVDVNIEINGVKLQASVKDYLNSNTYHLQEVPLFYSILVLNKFNDFGTHWLNMHALNVENHLKADEVLSQEVYYEALVSGNPFKESASEATIFVAIQRQTGKIAAASTKDIMLNRINKFNFSKKKGATEADPENIAEIKLQNTFVETKGDKRSWEGAGIRIGNVINELHQIKLAVSFNAAELLNQEIKRN